MQMNFCTIFDIKVCVLQAHILTNIIKKLQPGDLVAVKCKLSKPYDFPCGRITQVEKNYLGEIIHASLRKSNEEIVRRHVTDLIFFNGSDTELEDILETVESSSDSRPRIKRRAAISFEEKVTNLREIGAI